MLTNDNGENGIHYRMKGVSLNTVAKVAKEYYGSDLFKLYHDLFEGKRIDFNLLSTDPRFKYTKARTVVNCDKFTRGISFNKEVKRNVIQLLKETYFRN